MTAVASWRPRSLVELQDEMEDITWRLADLREHDRIDPGWLADEIEAAEADLLACARAAGAIVRRGIGDCVGSA